MYIRGLEQLNGRTQPPIADTHWAECRRAFSVGGGPGARIERRLAAVVLVVGRGMRRCVVCVKPNLAATMQASPKSLIPVPLLLGLRLEQVCKWHDYACGAGFKKQLRK